MNKKCIKAILMLFIFFTVISIPARAGGVVRITNRIEKGGQFHRHIQISSTDRKFFEDNPLIPRDPLWKMRNIEKRGTCYVLEGSAEVKWTSQGLPLLPFEQYRIWTSRKGFYYTILSYDASLKLEKPRASSGEFHMLAVLLKPIARDIAYSHKANKEVVSEVLELAGKLADNFKGIYQSVRLARLLSDTQIHYDVMLPSPQFIDYLPEESQYEVRKTFPAKELLGAGINVHANTRYISIGGIVVMIIGTIFFLGIIVLSVMALFSRYLKNRQSGPTGESDEPDKGKKSPDDGSSP